MKKILILTTLLVAISANLSFARSGFRGGGGGVVFNYVQPDLSPLNAQIVGMGIPELDKGMFLVGGRGFGMVSRNFRIGGMGAGGEISTDGYDPVNDLAREVTFSMGCGGVTLEYVRDLPFDLQLAAGGMIGWGGISLMIAQLENSPNWNGIWDNFDNIFTNDSNDQWIRLDNGLFILNPWVEVGRKILPWMGFTGKVGYFWSKAAGGNWTVGGSKVYGGPEIDLSNVNVEVAIIFGG